MPENPVSDRATEFSQPTPLKETMPSASAAPEPSIYQTIDSMNRKELDLLPHGAIQLDAQGTILGVVEPLPQPARFSVAIAPAPIPTPAKNLRRERALRMSGFKSSTISLL
jgi:hypothetical protein